MMLIEYAGELCVVGLQWETSYDGDFTKKQLIKRGSRFSASHYVAHVPQEQSKRSRTYGFGKLPKLARQDRKRGVYSLASIIARDRADSFCVAIPMGEGSDGLDQYAFVGILEGQPASGFDLIGNLDFVKEQAETFIGQNAIGRYYYLQEFGDPGLNLAGATAAEFVPMSGATLKVEPISKLVPIPSNTALLALVGAAAVGVVAVGVGSWYQDQQAAKEKLMRLRITPEMAYIQTRDVAFRQEANIPANASFPQLASLIFRLPIHLDGWVLDRVSCNATPAGQAMFSCPVTWSPRGGTYETFVSPIREAKVSYDANLALVTMNQDVKLPDVLVLQTSHIPTFPKAADFIKGIGSVFQDLGELGFKASLSRLQSVGNIANDALFESALYRLEWSLTGPIDQMQRAMQALPPSMTLTRVELSMPVKGSTEPEVPRISVSGVAYVR